MTLRLNTLCVAFLVGSACGPLEDDLQGEEASSVAPALNGSWTTENCSNAEKTKISQAFGIINSRLGTKEYRQCLLSAFMIERYEVIVEDMIKRLGQLPTKVRCVAPGACGGGAAACAGVPPFGSPLPETMSVEKDYLGTVSAATLAGTIVHEAAHTKGWNHYPDFGDVAYPWSVTVQTGTCMANLQNDGWSRLSPHGDSELSPVGGDGGQPFMVRCAKGERVTGITVDASKYVNRFRLRCSDGRMLSRVGEYKDSYTTSSWYCSHGWSMVGFAGWSDTMLRDLRAFCGNDAQLRTDVTPLTMSSRWLGGSAAGSYAVRHCPIGMAVVGAVGRSGARIDQVRWLCGDYDGVVLPNPRAWGYRGTRTGNAKIGMCSGNGVIHALYGHAGAEVDQLGAECFPTTRDIHGAPQLMTGNTRRHGIDFNGGTGGPVFNKACPAGTALVGLRVRSGARIDAIGGVCARPASWAAGKTHKSYTSLSGGNTGSYSTLVCPVREFVVGLKTWAQYTPQHNTKTIHGVAPYCRNLGTPIAPSMPTYAPVK